MKTKVAKLCNGFYWAALSDGGEMFLHCSDELKKMSIFSHSISAYEGDGISVCEIHFPFIRCSLKGVPIFEVDAVYPREIIEECEKCIEEAGIESDEEDVEADGVVFCGRCGAIKN